MAVKKWEYKLTGPVDVRAEQQQKQLNELGKEGWELVVAKMSDFRNYWIFKRELTEQ